MSSSFLIHSISGRLLGPVAYGTFGIVYALISTIYIVLGGGVKRAVTKYTADTPDRAGDIRFAGLKIQLSLCGIIAVILLVFSGPLSIWLNDFNLKVYIRFSAFIIPIAGILYVYVGYFDGCKQFNRTAIITIVHSVLKVIFVFLLLYLGYEIFGAITGILAGLLGTLAFAVLLGRRAPFCEKFEKKRIIQFALPVLSFFICISILAHIDLFFVKAILDDPAKTGYYTAAQTLSRLISFAMFPFGVVLLPFISSAIAKNDINLVRRYIEGSFRYILIIIVPVCTLLIVTAEQILAYVYGLEYILGAPSLRILFLGASCWGVTNAMAAIIQGYGHPGRPAIIFALMILLDIVLIQVFTRKLGIEGAAVATTCTFIMGMVLSAGVIYNRYAVLIKIRPVLNILVATFIVCTPIIFLKPSGLYMLVCYLLTFCVYIGILWALGELKREDMDLLVNAFLAGPSRSGFSKG
jgi:stage V sporulation protein B